MNRLRALIKTKYTTYKECAEKVGISTQLLSNFLKGHRDISRENYFKLADALGVSLDELRILMEPSTEAKSQYKINQE